MNAPFQIQENVSLRELNSFGIDARARYFSSFGNPDVLGALLEAKPGRPGEPLFILGGGSNILLSGDFPGIVLQNDILGIELVREDTDHLYIRAGAGEVWHELVDHSIRHHWQGLENLSLIPGKVGAAPMQNIGAYGVEIRDVFEELEAFDLLERKVYTLSANDCAFGYRDSIFKGRMKDRYVILSLTCRLNKFPKYNISYGAIRTELERMGETSLSIRAISEAVIRIRTSKLPDPAKLGNAGSFFKNPVVPAETFRKLREKFSGIIGYDAAPGLVKMAAGWMIEEAGWKGYRRGDAGCHSAQALVLVNYGQATGAEILALSEDIRESVREKFGVELEREVNVI
jgi:UDP-N-acetylmuramate dehydrogenase